MTARIVVGVDGSDQSRGALEAAFEEARFRHATVDAVIAHRIIPRLTWESGVVMPSADEQLGWARKTLEESLAAVPTEIVVKHIVAEGSAARALIDVAEGADLLVVGSRGHGGFHGLLLGSTSQHVVTHAPCPVLVVPHHDSD